VKIAVAMSGGVDSSVAAALLKQDGHEVIGATLLLYTPPNINQTPEAVGDAREAAAKLGIPHHVIDLRDIFERDIISYFCDEYRRGRTPNPCVRCNERIKFGALKEKAKELGADFIATGHYARIETDKATAKRLLKKGKDPLKDQSYFLYRLTQEQLNFSIFPLGNLAKKEVRQIAKDTGLPASARTESQEICFIPGDDYAAFLDNYISADSPGPIMDNEENILGRHRGIRYFTVGQRRGLGITAPEPLYVTAIAPEKNAVVVGKKEQTYTDTLVADELNWINGNPPSFPLNIKARIRYRHPEVEAIVTRRDNKSVNVKFSIPQMAAAPGQSVVFYDGDTVIGGGTISKQGR
jgi:tRNA-specific 2-thiouridylase